MKKPFKLILIIFISFFLIQCDEKSKAEKIIQLEDWMTPKFIDFTDYEIDSTNQKLIIPLKLSTNPFNRNFYLKNFPSSSIQIDTTKHYNSINLGKIELHHEGNKLIKDITLIDSIYLKNINLEELKNKYSNLNMNSDFSNYNCKNFKEAYYLFSEITWTTLIHETFTKEEYAALDSLLAPCLGPEYGEDFLKFNSIIKITNH